MNETILLLILIFFQDQQQTILDLFKLSEWIATNLDIIVFLSL